jgi:hypothetical protein
MYSDGEHASQPHPRLTARIHAQVGASCLQHRNNDGLLPAQPVNGRRGARRPLQRMHGHGVRGRASRPTRLTWFCCSRSITSSTDS